MKIWFIEGNKFRKVVTIISITFNFGKGQQVLEEKDKQGELTKSFIYGAGGKLAVLDESGQLHYIISNQLGVLL